MTTDTYYPPVMKLYRSDYPTKKDYIEVYRDCVQHYGKENRVRVFGGWFFFENADDMRYWRNQK